eukprot:1118699_1
MASKKVIQEMLGSMGFEPNYMQRAFKVYEKNYGHSYNVEVITEIIIRLQNKDQVKLNKRREYEKQEIVPINTSKDDTANNKSDAPANGNIEEKHHPVSHGTPRYKRKRRRAQKKRKKRKSTKEEGELQDTKEKEEEHKRRGRRGRAQKKRENSKIQKKK